MCSPPSPTRSRTRGHRTATAPMPVTISRSGRCPWRTSRRRPSSVNLSVWVLSQAATSASTACPNSVLAPLRKTSVSGSENLPGWVSWKTLVSVTAYHSFGGEVEALNTPTIRRPTPSCRHQLSALAPGPVRCHNLANTLSNSGERESGTDHLEEAVMVYYDSLKELTRERAAYLWARTVGNQGIAMALLAQRCQDLEKA